VNMTKWVPCWLCSRKIETISVRIKELFNGWTLVSRLSWYYRIPYF
jgi:hypothetical protein